MRLDFDLAVQMNNPFAHRRQRTAATALTALLRVGGGRFERAVQLVDQQFVAVAFAKLVRLDDRSKSLARPPSLVQHVRLY